MKVVAISYSSTRKLLQLPTEVGWNEVEKIENGNGVEGMRGSEFSVTISFSTTLTF